MKNSFSAFTNLLYSIIPNLYTWQIEFFNGKHFLILKAKLKGIPFNNVLEIASGTSPILSYLKFERYLGIDLDERFIKKAKILYSNNKNYQFIMGNAKELKLSGAFDVVLLSHATHHFTDKEVKKILKDILKLKFKYLVIYDGKPTGIFAPLLTKLDLGNNFREIEEFDQFFKDNKNYKVVRREVFKSDRPFYKYPLIVAKKI